MNAYTGDTAPYELTDDDSDYIIVMTSREVDELFRALRNREVFENAAVTALRQAIIDADHLRKK